MRRKIFRWGFLAATLLTALFADGADFQNTGRLNLGIAKEDAAAVFRVDDRSLTPAMEMYLNAVKEKIRQGGAREWPADGAGSAMPGEVVIQITLQMNGYIKDLRTVAMPGAATDGRDAAGESVIAFLKGLQPFPSFSPGMFEGCELITFATTVGAARGAGRHGVKPGAGAQGNNQRLELRTRIPF